VNRPGRRWTDRIKTDLTEYTQEMTIEGNVDRIGDGGNVVETTGAVQGQESGRIARVHRRDNPPHEESARSSRGNRLQSAPCVRTVANGRSTILWWCNRAAERDRAGLLFTQARRTCTALCRARVFIIYHDYLAN